MSSTTVVPDTPLGADNSIRYVNFRLAFIYAAVPVQSFITFSLVYHLWCLQKRGGYKPGDMSPQAVTQRRMTFGAVFSVTVALVYFITFFGYLGVRDVTPITCHILFRFQYVCIALHKFGLYFFIYYRIAAFKDFVSESGWKIVTVIAYICCFIYAGFLIFGVISPGLIYDTSTHFCYLVTRNGPAVIIMSVLLIIVDLLASVTGLVNFARVFFCGGIFSGVRVKDDETRNAAVRVVIWSTVAFCSTFFFLILVFAAWWGPAVFSYDALVNSFCIAMQYPGALLSLLQLAYVKKYRDDATQQTVKMVNTNTGSDMGGTDGSGGGHSGGGSGGHSSGGVGGNSNAHLGVGTNSGAQGSSYRDNTSEVDETM